MWPKTKVIYNHTLRKVSKGCYRCIDASYYRIIGNDDNIKAIDYDGGPLISKGAFIPGLGKVINISYNGIIQFEPRTIKSIINKLFNIFKN